MITAKILIIEDDQNLRQALVDTLSLAGYDNTAVDSAEKALMLLDKLPISLVVTDVNLPGASGHEVLKKVKQVQSAVPVIFITAYGNIHDAVAAMQNGAADYVTKPFEPAVLLEKIAKYQKPGSHEDAPIAIDPQSKQLFALAERVAPTEASVLITGESGSGKEVLARFIHDKSLRRDAPFVAINCAAIPENMLEATLFGYEKGAFTGAYQACPGKFELAQGGTLLLDEISEMDLNLQSKLLRVLQEKEVERLGGKKVIPLDVRIISTSNRDLPNAVKQGTFREDLFYRLNVFPLHWAPLRERPQDILPLAEYLLMRHASKKGQALPVLTEEARQALLVHPWQGNVREMENIIQRALILQVDQIIDTEQLQLEKPRQIFQSMSGEKKIHEHQEILDVLKTTQGNRRAAAKTLGMSERTLRYKLAQLREMGRI